MKDVVVEQDAAQHRTLGLEILGRQVIAQRASTGLRERAVSCRRFLCRCHSHAREVMTYRDELPERTAGVPDPCPSWGVRAPQGCDDGIRRHDRLHP